MKTFYDVLRISEDATIEEIENAYNKLSNKCKEALKDPFNSEKAEELLKKINVAYSVLSNEKNKEAYDKDLANMRANELMDNLKKNTDTHNDEIKKEEEIQKQEEENRKIEEEKKRIIDEKIKEEALKKAKLEFVQKEIDKQIQEQQKQLKIERKNQKKAQEAKEQEYRSYLRKMGLNVKEPLTVRRFFKILGATMFVLFVVFIIIQIPVVKNAIINNESIKSFLELFK